MTATRPDNRNQQKSPQTGFNKALLRVYDKNLVMTVKLRNVVNEIESAERKAYIQLTNRIHEAKALQHRYKVDKHIIRKSRMSNSVHSSNLSTTRQEIATKDDDSLSDVNTILLPAASIRPRTARCSTAASSKLETTANRSHLTSQGSSRLQISEAPSGSASQISSYREPAILSDLRKEVWVGEPEAICSVRRARKPSIKATSQQTQYSLRKLRRDMLDNRKCLRHAQA